NAGLGDTEAALDVDLEHVVERRDVDRHALSARVVRQRHEVGDAALGDVHGLLVSDALLDRGGDRAHFPVVGLVHFFFPGFFFFSLLAYSATASSSSFWGFSLARKSAPSPS